MGEMTKVVSGEADQTKQPYKALLGDSGPMWTRVYANAKDRCKIVENALRRVGAERMVVGHSVQETLSGEFRVAGVCNGQLILGDTAISRAYGGELSYVEYQPGGNAVAHYPVLGKEEVLPRSSLTPLAQNKEAGMMYSWGANDTESGEGGLLGSELILCYRRYSA